jgi:CheY-like chemotaxis protein
MNREQVLGSRILIVDDEDANLRLLEDLLAREGFHQVVATSEPQRVTDLVRAFEPDLILLDLKMPQMDGYAVLEALGLGAKDYLTKPFDTFEVALRVWNAIETRLLFKELRALVPRQTAPPRWRAGE